MPRASSPVLRAACHRLAIAIHSSAPPQRPQKSLFPLQHLPPGKRWTQAIFQDKPHKPPMECRGHLSVARGYTGDPFRVATTTMTGTSHS